MYEVMWLWDTAYVYTYKSKSVAMIGSISSCEYHTSVAAYMWLHDAWSMMIIISAELIVSLLICD